MFRRATPALAILVLVVVSAGGCRKREPAPVALEATHQGPLTFPPPDRGWTARSPLPAHVSPGELRDGIVVSWPKLDDERRFQVEGQVVRLSFSDSLVDPDDPKSAPKLTITPAVEAETVWQYGSEVELRAKKPFDPDVEYTIRLPEVTAPSGKKLRGGFEAKFKATPAIEIAGKTVHYLPEPGRARVVMATPADGGKLGGAQEAAVLYDQPVDLGLASKLVSLRTDGGAVLPANVRHPDRGTFEGEKVDPRFVVLVRPRAPLAPGAKLTLEAKAQKPEDETFSRTFTISEPTKLVSVECGSASECEVNDRVVRGPSTTSLRVRFSNPLSLGWDERQKYVTVSPRPKNLYVGGWGEDLSISGSFAPSTTYSVQVQPLRDAYGGAVPPLSVTFVTQPLPASATLPEGATLLDVATTRAFVVTTRNVERAELLLWPVPKGDVAAFSKAWKDVRSGAEPSGEPIALPFVPATRRDELVDTAVDLTPRIEPGRAYVAKVRTSATTAGAKAASYPEGSPASRAPLALLVTAGAEALAAHVHQVGTDALVQVFRLGSGEPVSGARVTVGDAIATTDALGAARLAVPAPAPAEDLVAAITAGGEALMLPLGATTATNGAALFPELASAGEGPLARDMVGMVVTDRGVYRPGSKMHLKALVRSTREGTIAPARGAKVRLRILDPRDAELVDEVATTSDRGSFVRDVTFEKHGHTGRYRVRLELDDGQHTLLAEDAVRVADFEAPRFKVDVTADGATAADRVKAKVSGKYLFGAPMSGARVAWTLRKSRVPVRGGALGEAGLHFDRDTWFDDEDEPRSDTLRPVTGEGVLGEDGTLVVDAQAGPLPDGPTELVLEADVSDASNRHVAAQVRQVKDPIGRHVGMRLARRFGDSGAPLRVELGVVDASGAAVTGAPVAARLERVTWTRTAERAESGALVERWRSVATTLARCEAVSATKPVACDLPVDKGGSYRVVASTDGRDGASASYYAWGNWGGAPDRTPSTGKKVPLVLDKARYRAGETAKLLVQSPYPRALALLSVEQGGVVRHEARRIEGPSATFDLATTAALAPWVHASVTLLPIGTPEPDFRVGAVRVPVSLEDARLAVKVSSAKPRYEVRDEAEITIEVKKGDAPVKDADVTLAVVDEGVLRMTSFHAKDPSVALRPGRPLDFRVFDSRAWLIARRERAHVAGGGDGDEADSADVRKNFVETAAWMPNLVTDAQGRVTVKVRLPDNLTEFRAMAVVASGSGDGGAAESSFLVTKPVLLEPVMPRFALRGDRFEAAAMVHNDTDAAMAAKVTVAGEARDVTLPAHGRTRVAVPMTADRAGTRTMRFAVEVQGAVRDQVEIPFRVDAPGVEEHPTLSGAFTRRQEIALEIPADAIFDEDAALSIKTGSALYPELGQRLGYLLDYPHGCVEQTTSSTIPLLAARTLLPWTGTTTMEDQEIDRRIRAGVDRLASMTTSSGGLAYWPGGHEPNTYGSAYALRALVRARALGIESPKLVERVTKYLTEHLAEEDDPGTRVAIAEALALAKALPESAADSLYEQREKLDAFGLASLALALASLPGQDDRVRELLDRVEAAFDADGAPKENHGERDWHTWGSSDRDRAQATIALSKLRKASPLLPKLAQRLARGVDDYTTQSTAWTLMALADYVGDKEPNGGVDATLRLEGRILDTTQKLGGDNKEVRVPLRDLAGKKLTLVLEGDDKTPSAFALEARYKRPLAATDGRLAKRAPRGPSIHRAYSDPSGKPLDLAHVKAGQMVRVALRIELPEIEDYRRGYVAITDRVPAGLAPVDPDLATTGYVSELSREHPFHDGLSGGGQPASHVDLRTDRVQIYFDRAWGRTLHATYVARATTPGSFTLPPAHGELMYEPDSESFSDAGSLTVVP